MGDAAGAFDSIKKAIERNVLGGTDKERPQLPPTPSPSPQPGAPEYPLTPSQPPRQSFWEATRVQRYKVYQEEYLR